MKSGSDHRQAPRILALGARLEGLIVKASALVCALALSAMALGIVAEILARSFFDYSFQSVDEISGYLLVAVTFLGLCVAVHENALFRVEILIERLSAARNRALELAFSAMFIVFLVIVDYQCVLLVIDSYSGGYVAPTLLGTPLYIPQLLMPVGLTATIVVLGVRLFQALCGPAATACDDRGVGQ